MTPRGPREGTSPVHTRPSPRETRVRFLTSRPNGDNGSSFQRLQGRESAVSCCRGSRNLIRDADQDADQRLSLQVAQAPASRAMPPQRTWSLGPLQAPACPIQGSPPGM